MKESMAEGDTRAVWELARRVGARGRAAQKRRVYVQNTTVPTDNEWKAYLAKDGKDDGFKAVELDCGAAKGMERAWEHESGDEPGRIAPIIGDVKVMDCQHAEF